MEDVTVPALDVARVYLGSTASELEARALAMIIESYARGAVERSLEDRDVCHICLTVLEPNETPLRCLDCYCDDDCEHP